ncbi:HIT domain-containing protein [bacterium]|nr:HIT domain-containing protein [bacterium]
MDKTVFERIRDREIPAQFEYEDDQVMAFRDIHPQAPVHVLIVPKVAYPTLEDIPPEDDLQLKLILVARQVANKLGIAKNYRLLMNVGRQVQEVAHVHLHLLGGWRAPQANDPETMKLV